MTQEELKLKELATTDKVEVADVTIDYIDDNIVMIDNVKLLTKPNSTRVNMNFIGFCSKGKVQMELNGKPILFDENHIIICPPNTTFGNIMISPDFDFKAMFLSDRILMNFLREKMQVWTELLYIHKMHVIPVSKDDQTLLYHFDTMLNLEIHAQQDNPYRIEVIQSILRGAILSLCGALEIKMLAKPVQIEIQKADPNISSAQNIFQQFISIINKTPKKHRSVDYYAGLLYITPKYLSYVCKKQSGKTANEWIQEHVMEDIRYYLKQTNYSIKQICSILGFPNSSFFGKYVKDHFGMTPVQLRRQ